MRLVVVGLLTFFLSAGFSLPVEALSRDDFPPPVRVIASADVHQMARNKYAVREFVDVYNDDFVFPLVVSSVTADTWRGQQIDMTQEDWFDWPQPMVIQPGKILRVAERKRIVIGRDRRDWWVRWVRFTVETNRGFLRSNPVASPFRPPGSISALIKQFEIDTMTEPGAMTPLQKNLDEQRHYPD